MRSVYSIYLVYFWGFCPFHFLFIVLLPKIFNSELRLVASHSTHWGTNGDRCKFKELPKLFNKYLLLASFARSVRQVMNPVFSFLLWPKREARGPWKQGRKKRGSITCRTDRAIEANKMFIIWLCWLFRFWKGDGELEVRTATYGPGIDQSQHAKSVSHIIINNYSLKSRNWRRPQRCLLKMTGQNCC